MNLPEINISGNTSLIPIDSEKQIAVFSIALEDDLELTVDFFKYFAQAFQNDCDFGLINDEISYDDVNSLFGGTIDADLVIFLLLLSKKRLITPDRNESLISILNRFSTGKEVILISNLDNETTLNMKNDLFFKLPELSQHAIASAIVKLSGRIID